MKKHDTLRLKRFNSNKSCNRANRKRQFKASATPTQATKLSWTGNLFNLCNKALKRNRESKHIDIITVAFSPLKRPLSL